MQYLKAGAAATILIGPFLDKDNGVTPETGVTLAAADAAELMKHDGTTFVDLTSDSRTFTHKQGGMYTLVLGTGDTDTEGRLTVFIADDDVCLPVWKDFMVVNANVYDSLFAAAATDYLQVDAKQLDGSAIQQAGGYAKVKDDEGNTLANESKQDTIDANVDSILVDTGTTLDGKLDTIDGNVDDILVDTAAIDGHITANYGATEKTNINHITADYGATEKSAIDLLDDAEAGLADLDSHLDTLITRVPAEVAQKQHLVNGTGDITPPENKGIWNVLGDGTDSLNSIDTKIDTVDTVVDGIQTDLSNVTDGLGALKALIDTLDTVADAIKAVTDNLPDSGSLDDLAAILTDTGTTLEGHLTDIEADTQDLQTQIGTDGAGLTDLGGMSTGMKAEVESECNDALVAEDLDHLVKEAESGNVTTDSIIGKLASTDGDWSKFSKTTDSLQSIRDVAPHGSAMVGTNSAATAAALSTHDSKLDTVDTNVDSILTDTGTTLDGKLDTIDGNVDAILVDTDTTLPATLATIAGYLDTEVAAIKAKTDLLPSGVPKNVALSNLTFLMVLSSDGKTPAPSKTITAQISKDGEAFANTTNSVAEIAGGFYKISLTATEMNADAVALVFTETDCLQRSISFFPSD